MRRDKLEYSDRQAMEKRSIVIGPIYLFAMHASRTRRTEPAGQREKTTSPPGEAARGEPTTGWSLV